jgi:hypothetical protein
MLTCWEVYWLVKQRNKVINKLSPFLKILSYSHFSWWNTANFGSPHTHLCGWETCVSQGLETITLLKLANRNAEITRDNFQVLGIAWVCKTTCFQKLKHRLPLTWWHSVSSKGWDHARLMQMAWQKICHGYHGILIAYHLQGLFGEQRRVHTGTAHTARFKRLNQPSFLGPRSYPPSNSTSWIRCRNSK